MYNFITRFFIQEDGSWMFNDLNQLAESKLILLYIIDKIGIPIPKNQLTQIVLENNLVNYFLLQQYLTELHSSSFIESLNKNDKKTITITEKGKKVLSMFLSRIPEDALAKIECYIKGKIDTIKKETYLHADYTIENNDIFIVNLKAQENDMTLIDIKVNVPSKKHAIDLCQNWKSNSSKIYNDIMKTLLQY
jgi:predicted transcriptional regulator